MIDEYTSSPVLISTSMAYKEKCRMWLSKRLNMTHIMKMA